MSTIKMSDITLTSVQIEMIKKYAQQYDVNGKDRVNMLIAIDAYSTIRVKNCSLMILHKPLTTFRIMFASMLKHFSTIDIVPESNNFLVLQSV